jgi:Lon protease-like protein
MHFTPDDLPAVLPIFPIKGVLLLPGGRLPLNIFEPRYLAMVEDALKGDRLIGMIQPQSPCRDGAEPKVFPVGCAGRIVSFAEQEDGRYEIMLSGISRFKVAGEVDGARGYRRVAADWTPYHDDWQETAATPLDRARLTKLLHSYFALNKLSADWEAIEKTANRHLITCLAMICPFDAREKQALLEAPDPMARATLMMGLMEMAIAAQPDCGKAH